MKLSLKHPLVIVAGLLSVYYLLFVCTMTFNNNLGKLALLGAVVGSSFYYGRIGAIVSATIALMLLHKSIEGIDGDASDPTPEDGETAKTVTVIEEESTKKVTVNPVIGESGEATGDVSNATDDQSTESDEDAGADAESDAATKCTYDMLSVEEKMKCKQDNGIEPDTQEGFSLIGNILQDTPMALSSSSQEFATFN